jgi:hypothetical protein
VVAARRPLGDNALKKVDGLVTIATGIGAEVLLGCFGNTWDGGRAAWLRSPDALAYMAFPKEQTTDEVTLTYR